MRIIVEYWGGLVDGRVDAIPELVPEIRIPVLDPFAVGRCEEEATPAEISCLRYRLTGQRRSGRYLYRLQP